MRLLAAALGLGLVAPCLASDSRVSESAECRVLEQKLKVSDLRLANKALDAKIKPLGGDGQSETGPIFRPSVRVQGTPDWHILLAILTATGDSRAILLRRVRAGNEEKVQALVLPNPKVEGGPSEGSWRRVGDMLLGAGYMTESSMYPPGALQVIRLSKTAASQAQGIVTPDEIGSGGIDFDPHRSTDVLAVIRREDFRCLHVAHGGPHLEYQVRWRFRNGRFHRVGTHILKNAIYVLDRIADAVVSHKRQDLAKLVPDPTLRRAVVQVIDTQHLGAVDETPENQRMEATLGLVRFGYDFKGPRFFFKLRLRRWELVKVYCSCRLGS